jgi:hypothetical protein
VQEKDAWTSFLDFLSTIITPNWEELIGLLPLFVLIGLVGPILTLLVLYHLYVRITGRHGRIRLGEPEPMPAPLGEDGLPLIPANVPFCSRHGLLYPLSATVCELDKDELSVRCPIDDTVRVAGQQLCRTCGTKYLLGASSTALMVRRTGRPPAGGAAAA